MVKFIIKVIKCFTKQAHILSPIDRHLITKIASNEGVKEETIRERIIQEVYVNLYHLEDVLKKEGVEVTVCAIEMGLPEGLISAVKKINPTILVVLGPLETSVIESLRDSLSVPMVLLPIEEK